VSIPPGYIEVSLSDFSYFQTENRTSLSNPKYSCDSNQYPLINEYLIKLLELSLAEKLSWRPYKVTELFSTSIHAWNKKWCPSKGFPQLSTCTCHFQPLNPPPPPVHLSHPFRWHRARDNIRSEIMKPKVSPYMQHWLIKCWEGSTPLSIISEYWMWYYAQVRPVVGGSDDIIICWWKHSCCESGWQ